MTMLIFSQVESCELNNVFSTKILNHIRITLKITPVTLEELKMQNSCNSFEISSQPSSTAIGDLSTEAITLCVEVLISRES